jgi:hypothetical protein
MRGIIFWLIGFVSFITVTVGTIFVPGSFLNRAFSVASCAIFSFNTTFCTPNLGHGSDRAIAAGTASIKKVQDDHSNLLSQEPISIEKQRNSFLAFKSFNNEEGHRGITRTALQGSWISQDGKTTITDVANPIIPLEFQAEAIREIERANRLVDIKEAFLDYQDIGPTEVVTNFTSPFSNEYDYPWFHFDRETFYQGSERLINLKKEIINQLMPVTSANTEDTKARGRTARQYLGQALHTLQDFYAHSNWFELGFGNDEIETRLGREHIPDPIDHVGDPKVGNIPNPDPKFRRDTSEPVSEKELLDAAYEKLKFDPEFKDASVEGKGIYARAYLANFRGEIEDLASAHSTKPGILKPEFRDGSKDKTKLTTGYFMGNGQVESCSVPTGKTRHGAFFYLPGYAINCPDGLNKDDPTRPGYFVVRAQAIKASKDYISQIFFRDINSPNISGNIPAIKALMGIEDSPKETPCNTPSNQSKSDNKQEGNSCKVTAHSANDPHLVTFDGLKYDLQTLGEFTLIKSNNSVFEVQARQTPWNNSASVSINSAVAMKVGSDRVAIYAQGLPDADTTTPLRVNGKSTTIQGGKLALDGGGEILQQGGTYVVSVPTGEKVLVSLSSSFLNISPVVHNRSGKYSGLLGNVNGNPNDDLQIRGGTNVLEFRSTYGDVNKVLNLVGLRPPGVLDKAEKVYFDQLYKGFGNSWRVKQEESLFDYPPGKTTQSYIDPSFPNQYLTLNMLSADQIQKARNACTEAKVTQDLMEGCIFDVGFSGFSEFARTAAQVNGYIDIVNQLFPGVKIPKPQDVINLKIEEQKRKICAFGICPF